VSKPAPSWRTRRVVLNRRAAVQADLDVLAWAVGVTAASALRVDFHLSKLEAWGQVAVLPILLFLQLLVGGLSGLYAGRWRPGSFDEIAAVVRTVVAVTVVLFAVDFVATDPHMVPLSSVVGGGVIALVCQLGVRYERRLRAERRQRPHGDEMVPLVVVGAGVGGDQMLRSMLADPESPYLPVALLDDDPEKRNLRLHGIPVMGTTAEVERVVQETGARSVLVAVPSSSRDFLSRIATQATVAGVEVRTVPSVRELIDGRVDIRSIRPVRPSDLLGRREVQTDIASIAGYLQDRRVLVTGAGGSIGSELCRQIVGFRPTSLYMLDRDESALHALKLSIDGRALLDTPDLILADLRDEAAVRAAFERSRPQVVFHAAALKHLPLLEQFPFEGVQSNVWGSERVARIACEFGVERFVNISTDKAADPESVLGYTKRLSERITAWWAGQADGVFLSVRFGNVLGSRGSMLDAFQAQIQSGGPVTVTDPEVTRFFMTVNEAVQLVIQAGAIGRAGEAMVLDMGDPVRIADVAKLLVAQATEDVEIVYTGLRPGEKMHEVLIGHDEHPVPSVHPSINAVAVPPLAPQPAFELADGPGLLDALRSLVATGAPVATDS
jgi:FlaA1/EpsC-like NDP-sugar epimerase